MLCLLVASALVIMAGRQRYRGQDTVDSSTWLRGQANYAVFKLSSKFPVVSSQPLIWVSTNTQQAYLTGLPSFSTTFRVSF